MARKSLNFKIGANAKPFHNALKRIRTAVTRVARVLKTALKPLTMMLTMVNALSGAAISLGVRRLAGLGAELNHMASATGLAVDKLAVLRQAFMDAGLSAEDLRPTLNQMQKFITTSADSMTAEYRAAWKALKLKPEDLLGQSADRQFETIIARLQEIPDAARRSQVAMIAFGAKRGPALLPISTESIEDARRSLGSLPGTLGQIHGTLERIDTIIGRVGAKFHQFFSGFIQPHLGPLANIMEHFNNFDFTPLGMKLGKLVAEFLKNMQQMMKLFFEGNLFEYLKHKLLGLAHLIAEVFTTTLVNGLKAAGVPGMQDGFFKKWKEKREKNREDYYQYRIDKGIPIPLKEIQERQRRQAGQSPADFHFEKAADLFENAGEIPFFENPNNWLEDAANIVKKMQTPPAGVVKIKKQFSPLAEFTETMQKAATGPAADDLQKIGGGGRIANTQNHLATLASNSAQQNQHLMQQNQHLLKIISVLSNGDPFGENPFAPPPPLAIN